MKSCRKEPTKVSPEAVRIITSCTYPAQIVSGRTAQPTFQRICRASGDASRNATVVGARSMWRF